MSPSTWVGKGKKKSIKRSGPSRPVKRLSAAKPKPAKRSHSMKRLSAAKPKLAKRSHSLKRLSAAKPKPANRSLSMKRLSAAKPKLAKRSHSLKRPSAAKPEPAKRSHSLKRLSAAKPKLAKRSHSLKRLSAAKPKLAKRSYLVKPSGAATLQSIVDNMKREHPHMENQKTRALVKLCLNKGVESGQIAHHAGRWSIAASNEDKVCIPDGRQLMTRNLVREYIQHMKDSHEEARVQLADTLGEVEAFITKKRGDKKDEHLTDALEMSMVNTVIRKYCSGREAVRAKAARHLNNYFQEVKDVPRRLVGTMKKAKPAAELRRRLPNDY